MRSWMKAIREFPFNSSRSINSHNHFSCVPPTFHPEYGRYMLESTPGAPYTGSLADLLSVESNMRYRFVAFPPRFARETGTNVGDRRSIARKYLKDNEIPMSFTSFPRLGAPGVFTEPYFDPANAVSSHSMFLPEEITNPHARFPLVSIASSFTILTQL